MLQMNMFKTLKDFNLFTHKIYVLDYIVEDVSRLGALNFIDTFPTEHLNYITKWFERINKYDVHATW